MREWERTRWLAWVIAQFIRGKSFNIEKLLTLKKDEDKPKEFMSRERFEELARKWHKTP
jgi:hypothetical protein